MEIGRNVRQVFIASEGRGFCQTLSGPLPPPIYNEIEMLLDVKMGRNVRQVSTWLGERVRAAGQAVRVWQLVATRAAGRALIGDWSNTACLHGGSLHTTQASGMA